MQLAGAIIAGGFSRRMGQDKALLPTDGYATLVERQLDELRACGVKEILVSCRPEQTLPLPADALRVHDDGARGPIAGLAGVLAAMRADAVIVLAVDLGRMDAAYLQTLVAHSRTHDGRGVVPFIAGNAEPLAALWIKSCVPIVAQRVAEGMDLSLQNVVRACIGLGFIERVDVRAEDAALFANWNSPEDLSV